MGGLAHYFEAEGLPTTQISLIREHTLRIRPPRALWVPFELGRPLGLPDNPEFQKRVLRKALELLEASEGPVLADFGEEAPAFETPAAALPACPVSFEAPRPDLDDTGRMIAAFKQEMLQLRNWHDLTIAARGRTAAGASGLTPEAAADFLSGFVRGDRHRNPVPGVNLAAALRMAAEDVKAYYMEAAAAQPGYPAASAALADWFWGRTHAARVIGAIRDICLKTTEPDFQLLGKLLLVPRTQLHRFGEAADPH